MPNKDTRKRPRPHDGSLSPAAKSRRPNAAYIWVDESPNFFKDHAPDAISPAALSNEDGVAVVSMSPTAPSIAVMESAASNGLSPQASPLEIKRARLLINYFITQQQQLLANAEHSSDVSTAPVVGAIQQLLNIKTKKPLDTLAGKFIVDNQAIEDLDALIRVLNTKTIEELQGFIGLSTPSELDQKLKTIKMANADYRAFLNALTALGYSTDSANRIILRKSSKNTCKKLIECHDAIYTLFFNNHLEQGACYKAITDIASHDGGSKTLAALIKLCPKLLELNFTSDQIAKIAANIGGSKTLAALIELFPKLLELNFTSDQIAKIAANIGASKTLDALIELFPKLRELKFTSEQIAKIAANGGGSKTMAALIERCPKLLELNFTSDQIAKIAANNGGSKTLEALIGRCPKLLELNFTCKQIAKVAANSGGSKILAALIERCPKLLELNFTSEQITKVAANGGGSKSLAALTKLFSKLRELNFTCEQIATIAANNGGSKTLDALIELFPKLRELNFTSEQIAKVAANGGASKTLATVIEHFQVLRQLGLSLDNIVSVSSRYGGSISIRCLAKSMEQIISAKVDPQQLIVLNAHDRQQLQEHLSLALRQEGISSSESLMEDLLAIIDEQLEAGDIPTAQPPSPVGTQGFFSATRQTASASHGESFQSNPGSKYG